MCRSKVRGEWLPRGRCVGSHPPTLGVTAQRGDRIPPTPPPATTSPGAPRAPLHDGRCGPRSAALPGSASQPSPARPPQRDGLWPRLPPCRRCHRCPSAAGRPQEPQNGSHVPEAARAASSEHGGLRRRHPVPSPPQVRGVPPPRSRRPRQSPAAALGAGGQRRRRGRRPADRGVGGGPGPGPGEGRGGEGRCGLRPVRGETGPGQPQPPWLPGALFGAEAALPLRSW